MVIDSQRLGDVLRLLSNPPAHRSRGPGESRRHRASAMGPAAPVRFAASRFDALYYRWPVEGDAVLTGMAELETRLDCALEMHCLPHP